MEKSTIRKPDFIMIGAAKSGTTTIYQYLLNHPDIYLTTPKEPDFFAVDRIYEQGLQYYQSLFADAKENQICGEASTTYSRLHQHPQTLLRMKEYIPQTTKFIYIMRHPIDRAYSFYTYRFKASIADPELAEYRNEFIEAKTFEEAIEETSEYIDSSLYLYQIEQYLQYYPRESFLFLEMDELIKFPQDTISKVINFLGLTTPDGFFNSEMIVANKREEFPEWYMRSQLKLKLEKIPIINNLLDFLPQNLKSSLFQIWKNNNFDNWQKKQAQYLPPPMLEETRKILIEKFSEPNEKLAQFLGKDLSHWSK